MDLLFYVPNTSFMQDDGYELLDCILMTFGFHDEGTVQFGDFDFRKYWVSSEKIEELPPQASLGPEHPSPYQWQFYAMQPDGLAVYMERNADFMTGAKLFSYGVEFNQLRAIGDKEFYQYAIKRSSLPTLAKICPAGPKPSRRMLEEHSYYKYLDRGMGHGMDLADWFAAEWECQERINELLKKLSIYN